MKNLVDPPESEGGLNHSYLTDLSPKDKPWDCHKSQVGELSQLYRSTPLVKLSDRLSQCSGLLEFGQAVAGDSDGPKLQLKSARFCRVRQCPVCQWRRSLMWTARILKAMPAIQAGHPTARFIFLTLTVRNCELSELRSTIKAMGQAFNNLQRRKEWPAIGWIRATEVTRGKDDSAHPHFHCLLMVEPGYFRGQAYLSQAKWVELWRSALKVTYEPSVHVRVVRPNKRDGLQGQKQATESTFATDTQSLSAAVVETLKYSVKPSDLLGSGTEADRLWLVELTTQLHKTRGVAIGGVLKQYLSESEPEDLVTESDHGELLENKSLWFGWREQVQRYAKQDY